MSNLCIHKDWHKVYSRFITLMTPVMINMTTAHNTYWAHYVLGTVLFYTCYYSVLMTPLSEALLPALFYTSENRSKERLVRWLTSERLKSRLPDCKALKLNHLLNWYCSIHLNYLLKNCMCIYCNFMHHARSAILKHYCTLESPGQIPRFWFSKSRVEFPEICNFNCLGPWTILNSVQGVLQVWGCMSLLSQSAYNLKGIEIRHTIGKYTVIQEK